MTPDIDVTTKDAADMPPSKVVRCHRCGKLYGVVAQQPDGSLRMIIGDGIVMLGNDMVSIPPIDLLKFRCECGESFSFTEHKDKPHIDQEVKGR